MADQHHEETVLDGEGLKRLALDYLRGAGWRRVVDAHRGWLHPRHPEYRVGLTALHTFDEAVGLQMSVERYRAETPWKQLGDRGLPYDPKLAGRPQ